jgi:hypothetical protein
MLSEHFPKFVSFMLQVEKYSTALQATNVSIIRRMRFLCWITKATDILSRMCNTSCFSTAQMVTRRRLNITFIRIRPSTRRLHRLVATVWTTFVEGPKSLPVQRLLWESLPSYCTSVSVTACLAFPSTPLCFRRTRPELQFFIVVSCTKNCFRRF